MRTGPMLMIAATLLLTMMSGSVKMARIEMSTLDLVFWRGTVAVPLAFALAWRGGLRLGHRRMFAVRLSLGFGAMLCFFTALKGLPLADATLITKVQPMLIALLAPLVLGAGERTSWRLWGLLSLGLMGCVVLLAPKVAMGSYWGLWAFGAAVLSAGAHIALRGLKDESAGAVVFYLQVGVTVLSGACLFAFFDGPTWPSPAMWPWILSVGVLATLGQLLMTMAYARDTASVIATSRYVGPVWGIIGDVLFFDGWPTLTVWIGGALVVSSGLMLVFGVDKTDQEPIKAPPP